MARKQQDGNASNIANSSSVRNVAALPPWLQAATDELLQNSGSRYIVLTAIENLQETFSNTVVESPSGPTVDSGDSTRGKRKRPRPTDVKPTPPHVASAFKLAAGAVIASETVPPSIRRQPRSIRDARVETAVIVAALYLMRRTPDAAVDDRLILTVAHYDRQRRETSVFQEDPGNPSSAPSIAQEAYPPERIRKISRRPWGLR